MTKGPASSIRPSRKPRRFDSNPTPRQNNKARSNGQIPCVGPGRRAVPAAEIYTMKRLLPCVALLAAGLLLFSNNPEAQAYPKPSINRIAWELDFQHGMPSRIMVRVPGSDAPQAFWYMPFTVTNNTGDEQQFLPVFELVDDKG